MGTRVLRDTFTRANGPIGTAESGQAWTVDGGSWNVASNQVQVLMDPALGLNTARIADVAENGGGWMQAVLAVAPPDASEKVGIAFRIIDRNNCWYAAAENPHSGGQPGYALHRVEAGTDTVVSAVNVTPLATDIIRAEWTPGEIRIYIDGALQISVSSTVHNTARAAGLAVKGTVAALTVSRLDDAEGGTMGTPVSTLGWLGFGIEGVAGTAVKSQLKVDLISESIVGQSQPNIRPTLRGSRMRERVGMGPFEHGGDFSCDLTADVLTKLIYAALSGLTTSGVADPYTHVLKTGSALSPLTLQVKRGDFFHVYAGAFIQRLTFRGAMDEVAQLGVSCAGRGEEKVYNVENSDAGVVYSSGDLLNFIHGSVTLHGAANVDTNDWEVSIDTGLARNRGLQTSSRAHNRAHPGRSVVTGSFSAVFDSIEAHRRFMGAAASTYPISLGNTPQTFAASLLYQASASRSIKVDVPKAVYSASGAALEGPDGLIIQRCSFEGLYDSTTASDVVVTVLNGDTNAVVIAAGTNI